MGVAGSHESSQSCLTEKSDSEPLVEGLQIVPTLYPNRPMCYSNELMLSSLQGGGEKRDPGNEVETIRPLVFPLKCLPPLLPPLLYKTLTILPSPPRKRCLLNTEEAKHRQLLRILPPSAVVSEILQKRRVWSFSAHEWERYI